MYTLISMQIVLKVLALTKYLNLHYITVSDV